jgi:hypothetical protein
LAAAPATVGAKASEAEAVERVAALVAAAAAAVGSCFDSDCQGRYHRSGDSNSSSRCSRLDTAAVTVVALDVKVASAFPDESIQKRFASVRAARSALASTWARHVIGRAFL